MNKTNQKESMAFVLNLFSNCYRSRMDDYESLHAIMHIFRACCDQWSVTCNASMIMTYFCFFLRDEMICFNLIYNFDPLHVFLSCWKEMKYEKLISLYPCTKVNEATVVRYQSFKIDCEMRDTDWNIKNCISN